MGPRGRAPSARVSYLYDLMDAAYDAAAIHDQSRALGHAPIVDRNFRAVATWLSWTEAEVSTQETGIWPQATSMWSLYPVQVSL